MVVEDLAGEEVLRVPVAHHAAAHLTDRLAAEIVQSWSSVERISVPTYSTNSDLLPIASPFAPLAPDSACTAPRLDK